MIKPTFLVIGGQKCGTTSLYYYLKQHPQVYLSPVKELRFFSQETDDRGSIAIDSPNIADFETYCTYFAGAGDEKAIGEVSPSYIYYPGTAERIKEHLPDVKIIAILRNPVDRAYSEYWHHWKMGRRLDVDFLRFVQNEKVYAEPHVGEYQDCIRRGLYCRQLSQYYGLFSENQILVLLYDDLCTDAHRLVLKLFEFLDVDTSFMPDVSETHNVGMAPTENMQALLISKLERLLDFLPMTEEDRVVFRRKMRAGSSLVGQELMWRFDKGFCRTFEMTYCICRI